MRQRTPLAAIGSLLALAIIALALLGCSGVDDSASEASILGLSRAPATATPAPLSAPAAPSTPAATALRLLVTPQPVAYGPEDPTFEALPGARAHFGEHQGAAYRVEVPQRWNGTLVLYLHGYRAYTPSLLVDPPPQRERLIAKGYAWAASSYQTNGYAVGVGAEDTRRLALLFAEKVGEPKRTLLYGTSLGGHVTTYLMERYPTEFDGAVAECGAVAGVEVLDYFVGWTILASHLTGVAEGRTNAPERYESAIAAMDAALGPVKSPTLAGRRFESVISELTGGRRPWRREGFEQARSWNFSLILDALRHGEAAASAATNQDDRYNIAPGLGLTDDELNRAVPRLAPAPGVRNGSRDPALAPMTGRIERPYLTIHGTGDVLVPISQEQVYRRAVEAAGREHLLVQRAIRRPGHCNFSPAEQARAFDDLARWVETGVRPPGDDITGDLMDAGLAFTEPPLEGDPGTP